MEEPEGRSDLHDGHAHALSFSLKLADAGMVSGVVAIELYFLLRCWSQIFLYRKYIECTCSWGHFVPRGLGLDHTAAVPE